MRRVFLYFVLLLFAVAVVDSLRISALPYTLGNDFPKDPCGPFIPPLGPYDKYNPNNPYAPYDPTDYEDTDNPYTPEMPYIPGMPYNPWDPNNPYEPYTPGDYGDPHNPYSPEYPYDPQRPIPPSPNYPLPQGDVAYPTNLPNEHPHSPYNPNYAPTPDPPVTVVTNGVGPMIDLDCDTNRSGVIEIVNDDPKEDAWSKDSGCVFLFNCDADNQAVSAISLGNGAKALDCEDDKAWDNSDLQVFVLRISQLPSGPKSVKLKAETSGRIKVKIFDGDKMVIHPACPKWVQQEANWIIDEENPYEEVNEYVFTTSGNEVKYFRIEAVEPISDEWDGIAKITAEAWNKDTIWMKTNPFVLIPNSEPGEMLYRGRNNGEIENIDQLGIPITFPDEANETDTWLQDIMQLGHQSYMRDDIRLMQSLLFMPKNSNIRNWVTRELVGSVNSSPSEKYGCIDCRKVLAMYQFETDDAGGNIEVTPPIGNHKLGVVITGSRKTQGIKNFFINQNVQCYKDANGNLKIPEVFTSFLNVGHVDEMVNFVPWGVKQGNSPQGYRMLYPEFEITKKLLKGEPITGFPQYPKPHDGAALFYGDTCSVEAHLTIEGVGQHPDNGAFCIITSANTQGQFNTGEPHYLRIYSGSGSKQTFTVFPKYVEVAENVFKWYFEIQYCFEISFQDEYMARMYPDAPGSPIRWIERNWFVVPANGSLCTITDSTLYWSLMSAEYHYIINELNELIIDRTIRPIEVINIPSLVCASELLENTGLLSPYGCNENIQALVDAKNGGPDFVFSPKNLATMLGSVVVVPIPCMFSGYPAAEHDQMKTYAFLPNMVNSQTFISMTNGQVNHYIIAKPYGPRIEYNNATVDIFEQYVKDCFPSGPTSVITFLTTWYKYHCCYGESHCGTNVRRSTSDAYNMWWEGWNE